MSQRGCGEIAAVAGAAQQSGLQPGDRLLTANGRPLRDVIDFRFYADGPAVTLRFRRGDSEGTVRLLRPAGVDWGLEFTEPLFDGVRRCTNRCLFCFLDQLPTGWRRSLYLRDDDYRLSFLYGNFVTLTNLHQEDWDRLEEQRLSPLYVSVHATEPDLRRLMLGRKTLPDIRRQLARLGRLGITVHTQVVLCPGINDGPHLERTLADLARLSGIVRSVALVPVGLTRFRSPAPAGLEGVAASLRPHSPEEARALVKWAVPRQRAWRRQLGRAFLYLADEFYLLASRPVPAARSYDGFPQVENGVGLARELLDDWARSRRRLPAALPRPRRITLAGGTLAAPLLQGPAAELAARVAGLTVEVLPVPNVTFGSTVTVSGLLTGEALRAGLRGQVQGDILFLPQVAFDGHGRTLDGATVAGLEQELGRPIVLAERMSQVVHALKATS
jgi:putative radical SAM enzyme (TIGR03279 family)